ncbi:MAG: glutathione S-transferase family protein [Sphingosinicella sp.]|nr:glutathione S-transferase family protein [Sphingosinicella sp.]
MNEQIYLARKGEKPDLTLFYQTHSPYARKTLVFAHEAGLADQLDVVHQETSPTNRNELVFSLNPLGKVPVLAGGSDGPIFDSNVICEYLDMLHDGAKLIPEAGPARWKALRFQAAAQGLADAGIALRWETVRRPEALRYPPLGDGMSEKLLATYDWLEGELDPSASIDVGQIALATTLDWLEFRDLPTFRPSRPKLTRWFDQFLARPSMQATPLSGETVD